MRSLSCALLAALLFTGCSCEEPLPAFPTARRQVELTVVESAAPGGGSTFTAATSDLTVPPREGDLGWWVSLVVDTKGRPHVAYTDAFNGELHYAVRDEGRWKITAVDTYGAVGKYSALAVDADDRPHIVYYNQDKKRLHYATLVGPGHLDPKDRRRPFRASPHWLFEVVDDGPEIGLAARLFVDPDGTLHAFYYSADERFLHSWREAAELGEHVRWKRRVIDAKAGGSHSIAFGYARAEDGTRHVSYAHWDMFDSELRYARLAPAAHEWQTESVLRKKSSGWKSGLFLNDEEEPVIVFLALMTRRLRLAQKTDGEWKFRSLLEDANTMDLHRGPNGRIVLAYEYLPEAGFSAAVLHYLSRPDARGDLRERWTRIDTGNEADLLMSSYLSLFVGPGDRASIAFYDGGIRGVKVLTEAAPAASPAQVPSPLEVPSKK